MKRTTLGLCVGICLGLLGSWAPRALASRNSVGTYALPAGNPVQTGTTITSSWANTTLADVSTEITNSLDRNGHGAMLQPLQCVAGTVTAPGLTFSGDPNTGFYRVSADKPAIAAGGVKAQEWTTTGSTVTGTLTSGSLTATGSGAATGVLGVGGGTSGAGVQGSGGAPNGWGIVGYGNGSGQGVIGRGVTGAGGDFASTSGPGLLVGTGNAQFTASAPASTTAFSNTLTPTNLVKAWGRLAGSTPTVTSGFNVASANCSAFSFHVTMASPMANTNYMVMTTANAGGGTVCSCYGTPASTTTFTIDCYNTVGQLNLCASTCSPSFLVLGAQ